jgi:oligopeptide/dipeptide ABC transporter ATP-binding protein
MAAPLMVVDNVVKHFPVSGGQFGVRTVGHVRAVDGVSFTIAEGEVLALVGESGCGKSTTARLVLRLWTPTSGTVFLDGRSVHALKGADLTWFRTSVQAVFQDPWASLSPRMRVRNIVAEALVVNRKASRDEVRERVGSTLEKVGMKRWHGDLFPHEFSGGQRQRIALASALITEPRLLVLDEPASALDVSVRAQVINLLRDIQTDLGTSYLLISHDLETVRYVADRVAVMYMGRIVEMGTTEQVFTAPQHPYTQVLLESVLPRHPRDRRSRPPIVGEMQSPLEPPSGCRFRTRCPRVMEVCREPPPSLETEPGRTVACHLYSHVPFERTTSAAGAKKGGHSCRTEPIG